MLKKIYLATAYTGNEKESFETVTKVSGMLMEMQYIVFSPVTHGHTIANWPGIKLPIDHKYWLAQCEPFISDWAEELWVLNEWRYSEGVTWEINLAEKLNIPVKYISYKNGVLRLE